MTRDGKDASRTGRGFFGSGLRLGRLFGFEVVADVSLLVIFFLVAVSLGMGVIPTWHPTWSTGLVWSVALGAAVLFFLSILLHELSHAIVARAHGMQVAGITLFLFGGIAHIESEPPHARAEFSIAIVGPLTSIAIGVLASFVGARLGGPALAAMADDPEAALQALGPGATLLLWLGPINILLGLFNLVPGFPLDGGRVLRSILWWATGDLRRATRYASYAGQGVAGLLIAVGILTAFGAMPGLRGGFIQGLWLVLIGWFLNHAAKTSYQQLVMREALENVPVERLMFSRMLTVEASVSIAELVRDFIMQSDQRCFPVERAGRFVGLVCLDDVRRTAESEWKHVLVETVMTPVERLVTLAPRDDASEALKELGRREVDQLPVVDRGELKGMVRRQDILKWLAMRGSAHSR